MMNANMLYEQLGIDKDLVTGFTIFFSRFEYALKRTEEYADGEGKYPKPNWKEFAKNHDKLFNSQKTNDIEEAVNYLTNNPPKKQILCNGKLGWDDDVANEKLLLPNLLLSVCGVRNNLFHGGKFSSGPVTDPGRDSVLLKSCMVILEECLSLNDELHKHFFTDQDGRDISELRL